MNNPLPRRLSAQRREGPLIPDRLLFSATSVLVGLIWSAVYWSVLRTGDLNFDWAVQATIVVLTVAWIVAFSVTPREGRDE